MPRVDISTGQKVEGDAVYTVRQPVTPATATPAHVGLVEVDRCPVDLVAVHAASANTATAAATAHRAPPATASSEATTTHADGVGHLIVTIRSAIPA